MIVGVLSLTVPQTCSSLDSGVAPRDGLRAFFWLTFSITWVLQWPGVLASKGVLPGAPESYMPFVMLGVLGPAIAAWWVTRRINGKQASVDLLRSTIARPPHLGWLPLALVTPGALLTIGLVIYRVSGASTPLVFPPKVPGLVVAGLIIAIGEEVGWRGFAFPRLLRRMSARSSCAVLGAIWTVWHIPMFVGQGVPLSLLPAMFAFFIGGSVVFGWFYARTGGSLLIAIVLHLGAHLNNSHATLPENAAPLWIHTGMWCLAAALLLSLDRGTWKRLNAHR